MHRHLQRQVLNFHSYNEIPVPIPFEKAIRVERQARFHPTEYLFALAHAFEDAGGVIVQNCRVNDAKDGDIVEAGNITW